MPDAENEPGTHSTRAMLWLRERILSGEIVGGTRLFESSIAEQLRVSRTPVREAMSRLAEEGLLERMRHGGFLVRGFGVQDVIDAIELRGLLEGGAARLAAERGPVPERLETMRALLIELDACFGPALDDADFEAYNALNARFHGELAALSGSGVVCREIARARRLPFASPSAFLPDKADLDGFKISLRTGQDHHHSLVQAIAAGEGTRAEAIAREHARIARRNLEYLLEGDRALARKVPGLALALD